VPRHGLSVPARIAVFASGGGTNLQALIDRFHGGADAVARVELLVASRPGIGALGRAEAAGIPAEVVDPRAAGAGEALLRSLRDHRIDLVVLAGYLSLVPIEVVEAYRGRMLNIHPALLPSFGGPGMYGARVHQAVLRSGARISGATVHLVDERYDEGRIVAQWPVPVLEGDTPETLAARVLRVEHLVLPLAIERLVLGSGEGEPREFAFDAIPAEGPPEASLRRFLL
jgi:phosphoribosylglycinamide formyltransferase 1